MSEKSIMPVVKPSVGIVLAILLILLASAIALLILAESREMIVASYVLFALVASIVTYGLLGATGRIKTGGKQLGGSAAVFVIVLGMLLPFAREVTVDISGMLYIDGAPVKNAKVYLLEIKIRDDRRILEEHDKGQFEFKDVRGVKGEVRFSINLPGYDEKIVICPYKSGEPIRIEISTVDLKSVVAPVDSSGILHPGFALPSAADASGAIIKTICVHNFTNMTGQVQFDFLVTAIPAGIASHLADAPKVRIADRTMLRDVMKGLNLKQDDPVDERNALYLGKFVGTDFSAVGSFEWAGGMKINARVLNNITGEELSNISKTSGDRIYLEAAIANEIARGIGSSLKEPPPERSISTPPTPTPKDEALRLFDAKNYAGAYNAYCRASDADLDNIKLHRKIEKSARLAHSQQKFLDRYIHLVNQHPSNGVLRNYLGNAYLMIDPRDSEGKAHRLYEEALRLNPNFSPPLNNLGIIEYRQGNWINARMRFEQYLNACPEDAVGWVNFGLLHVDMVKKDHSDVRAADKAESALRKAIKLQPGLASAYKGLGEFFATTGNKAEALAYFQRSLTLNHDQPKIRQEVEILQRDLESSDIVVSTLDNGLKTRAAHRSGGIAELTNRAVQALDQGKLQIAEVLAAELCRVQPANPFSYRLLGRVYEAQGRKAEAQRAFKEAVMLSSQMKK